MKVIVCIKQCFDTETQLVLKNGTIDDSSVKFIINPYDEIALEAAIRIKEEGQAEEVVVVSAGSERVTDAIRTALAMGADRGILLQQTDSADEYCRAMALADILREEKADLILTGHIASDDGSSQVPTRIAEELGIPHLSVVRELNVRDGKARCVCEVDNGHVTVEVALPAVISVQISLNEPRYISMRGIMQSKKKPLRVLNAFPYENKVSILKYTMPEKKMNGILITDRAEVAVEKLAHWLFDEVKIQLKG